MSDTFLTKYKDIRRDKHHVGVRGFGLSVLINKVLFSFHSAEEVRVMNTSAVEDDLEQM